MDDRKKKTRPLLPALFLCLMQSVAQGQPVAPIEVETSGLNSTHLESVESSGEPPLHRAYLDDFRNGFSADGPAAGWFHFSAGPFIGDDGRVSTGPRGFTVESTGINASTGEPSFTKSVAPDSISGLAGGLDHVKWLAYVNHIASSGFPGFDAIEGSEVSCEWKGLSGRTFGSAFHPFGQAVENPAGDLRLAAFAANVIDMETMMVFDWFVTNDSIHVLYERLPFARASLGNYAAFTFAKRVASTRPGRAHDYRISYDRSANRVRWMLDGRELFSIERPGIRIGRPNMLIDHGGVEQEVRPRQILCGMGLFSLLDGAGPGAQGLVRLSDVPRTYFDTMRGEPLPSRFVDPFSVGSSRLFGQGARMTVRRVEVSYRRSRNQR